LTLIEKLNLYGKEKEPFFFCISYDLTKWDVIKLSQIPNNIKFEIDNQTSNKTEKGNILKKYPISYKIYKNKFKKVKNEIKNGNTYLINLTTKTKIKTKYSLIDLYNKSSAKFKLYYKDKFICFSPERFVKCIDNKIFTYPMKGTIDANIYDAKNKIINNAKELAEHTMIVDLLRNDLSMVSSNVTVEKFRYCETISAGPKNLIQVSSKISGNLENNWQNNIGRIITTMLPAGSITGTPKKQTIKIINEIEKYNRDFFTGIFGIFDGKNLDSAVMIRFIQKNSANNLLYKSGGGITSDSQVYIEYQEMLDKVYINF
jgi:para-aminobenzoate synthetase component 1